MKYILVFACVKIDMYMVDQDSLKSSLASLSAFICSRDVELFVKPEKLAPCISKKRKRGEHAAAMLVAHPR